MVIVRFLALDGSYGFPFQDVNISRFVKGEGLRYEIKDFVAAILSNGYYHSKVSKKENLKMAEVQEQYINGLNLFKI